jgi:membrane protein DedA with SNARE-associated domain
MRVIAYNLGFYRNSVFLLRNWFSYENEILFRPKHDPDKPPPAQKGDYIIVICMLAGAALLCTAGILFALKTWMINPFAAGAIGLVLGAILGTMIGECIKRIIFRRSKRPVEGNKQKMSLQP